MDLSRDDATGVALHVIEDLRWSGIDQATAIRLAKDLVGHAQQANLANGGTGAAEQVVALLVAAASMVAGMVKDGKLVLSFEQITSAIESIGVKPSIEA